MGQKPLIFLSRLVSFLTTPSRAVTAFGRVSNGLSYASFVHECIQGPRNGLCRVFLGPVMVLELANFKAIVDVAVVDTAVDGDVVRRQNCSSGISELGLAELGV